MWSDVGIVIREHESVLNECYLVNECPGRKVSEIETQRQFSYRVFILSRKPCDAKPPNTHNIIRFKDHRKMSPEKQRTKGLMCDDDAVMCNVRRVDSGLTFERD